MSLTIDTLAAEARWDRAQIAALPGRCRGDALGGWGENLVRRFGSDALAKVRTRVGTPYNALSAVLTSRDWVPVGAQLVLTEAICDEYLGGDLRALYPLLVEDTRAGLGRIQLALIRTVGAGRVLARAAAQIRDIYERGTAEARVEKRRARVELRGTPLFANPTWRLLQLFATRTLLELAGTPGTVTGEDLGDGFATIAAW
jgi:hypothetical protein